ncbi:response regulator transcription factor [Nocardioides speluncae]|uniref:response regulator transcription factor n=1 Tax=Nocardioides speluncae TaxID=2670337 RepID=UPI000D69805E|nr:response regulator transcription factor [Nocardioides speluncae]
MRLLVVEDEPTLAEAIAEWLRAEAHAVDVAFDGASALEHTSVNDYDVVILDRDLPVIHGDEVCRRLSALDEGPSILMLTASAEVPERVAGFALGADDYVPKPFAFAELTARVLALGRRSGRRLPPILTRGELSLDPARHEVFRGHRFVPLAKKEFGVLAELLRAEGAVVSAETLLTKVWDEHADPFTGAVKLTIHKLRRKLGEPELVETVTGVGYRIR